jgi:hypothetical protein
MQQFEQRLHAGERRIVSGGHDVELGPGTRRY